MPFKLREPDNSFYVRFDEQINEADLESLQGLINKIEALNHDNQSRMMFVFDFSLTIKVDEVCLAPLREMQQKARQRVNSEIVVAEPNKREFKEFLLDQRVIYFDEISQRVGNITSLLESPYSKK